MLLGLKIFHFFSVLIFIISVISVLIISYFQFKKAKYLYIFFWILIFTSSYFFILSSYYLIEKSYQIKILLQRNGKVEEKEFEIDYENPLWIIKKDAKEYYYGDTLRITLGFPYEREVIAYFGIDRREYNMDLLRAGGIYKIEFPYRINRIVTFILTISILPLFIILSLFTDKKITFFTSIIKILLVFYIISMAHFFISFKFSLRRIVFALLPLFFYFISKKASKFLKDFFEFKITFSYDFKSPFWKITFLLSSLLLFSLILNIVKIELIKNFFLFTTFKMMYQSVLIFSFILFAGVYWNTYNEVSYKKLFIISFIQFIIFGVIVALTRDLGFFISAFFAFLLQIVLVIYYRNDIKQKNIISVPVLISALIGFVIMTFRIIIPWIIYSFLFPKYSLFTGKVALQRILMLKLPFLYSSFKQLLLSFLLMQEGFLFGKGFFRDFPIRLNSFFFTDHSYSTFSFSSGILILLVFYIIKFLLYTLIVIKILEQSPPERRKRFSIMFIPVIFCFLLFDILPLFGTFRFFPFTGLPTIFLSYSPQLTLVFMILISPFFSMGESKENGE